MVLKVAILAEKYAVDYTWYVDTILNLIRIAGDYVSEEVRNIQIRLTNICTVRFQGVILITEEISSHLLPSLTLIRP